MPITFDGEAIRRFRMFILSILTPRVLIVVVLGGVMMFLIAISVSAFLVFSGTPEPQAGKTGLITGAVTIGLLIGWFNKLYR